MAKQATTEPVGFDELTPTVREQYLAMVQDPTLADPAEVSRGIVQRIMQAETFDDILAMGEASAKKPGDMTQTPFKVTDITWHRSSPAYEENSAGVFVVLTLLLRTGREEVVTTGAENVLAALYKGQKMGAVPGDREMEFKQVETSRGFHTFWLIAAKP